MKLYLAVIFVSVKLLGETFPEGISNGVRGCDISVPFSRRTVALAGVFTMVRFVGLTAITDVAVLMANKMTKEIGIPIRPVTHIEQAAKQSDVIVTCTTSRQYFLKKEYVREGAFVAAVGADSHDKQELDPYLLASSKVVTDILEQCARIGDLHHAIRANVMSSESVYAQLHEIVSGIKPGRTSDEEIVIFDSTGTAIQDAASAAVAYQRAVDRGIGRFIDLIES